MKAALGLTLHEAENAFAKAIAEDQRLDASDIQRVMEEKRQVIREAGCWSTTRRSTTCTALAALRPSKTGSDGGRWFSERLRAVLDFRSPRGCSSSACKGVGKPHRQAIASQWTLPLLRLDVGRIFSGLAGSSEENLRRAIRVAESAAPAVLWVDEIDKALAGSASSDAADGGVSARTLGVFHTWLQEKKAAVFVVATANRVEGLPPDFSARGASTRFSSSTFRTPASAPTFWPSTSAPGPRPGELRRGAGGPSGDQF